MASYIHLIRHGITEGIQRKCFYGWKDLPVVEEGFEELEKFKAEGVYPQFDMEDAQFFVSGLVRTMQTLKCIYGDVDYTINEKLKEINFGDWEGKKMDAVPREEMQGWANALRGFRFPNGECFHDIDKRVQRLLDTLDDDGEFRFPNGDSMLSFAARIREGMEEVVGLHRMKELSHRHSGKDAVTVVVCHGGTIAGTMETWFPGQKQYFMNWTLRPNFCVFA